MYKFEIYKNTQKTVYGSSFIDTARYDEDLYVLERVLNPVWEDLSLKYVKENGRAFFRTKLDGSFSLVGDDFDWINNIRLNAIESNKYRVLKIWEILNGVRVLRWVGFFSVIVGEWDLNKCSVKFSELVVWDEYTRYLENVEQEKNMLDIYKFPVKYSISNYESEGTQEVLWTYTMEDNNPCYEELPDISPSEYFLPDAEGNHYTLYSRQIALTTYGGVLSWVVTGFYRRDFLIQVNSPGAGWTDLGAYPYATSTEHKWVRNYLGITSPSYLSSYVFIQYQAPGETFIWNCVKENWQLVTEDELTDFTNERARPLRSVINNILYGVAFPSPFYSQFFTAAINPITGEENELLNLFVLQFSDLRETSDPATRAMYSFKDIESFLKLLNVYWHIDDRNGITFEHKKFYDNGLSYGSALVGIDVFSDPKLAKQAKSTSKFSYGNKALPRIQEIKTPYSSGDDFYGSPILFFGSMANWADENKLTTSSTNMSTDLLGAILNEDSGKDGFMIVATELDGGWYRVTNGTGALSGNRIVNSPLAISNIEDNYWRWGGQSAVGVMNNQPIEFDSTENNFIQEEFSITLCDLTFNPYRLVRTEYGLGRVEEASLALKDKRLTLSLSYGI